ncbi:unnamed protein product, partial [Musa acuminata subsp. burmannicoides]
LGLCRRGGAGRHWRWVLGLWLTLSLSLSLPWKFPSQNKRASLCFAQGLACGRSNF